MNDKAEPIHTALTDSNNFLRQNEAENALIALADPLAWRWQVPTRPEDAAHWLGESERARYQIVVPAQVDDVDTLPQSRLLRLNVMLRTGGLCPDVPIRTVGQGKSLCVRHALGGDLSEMRSARKALKTEQQAYHIQIKDARRQLYEPLRKYAPPLLAWRGSDPLAMMLQITGTQGDYAIHFEPARRWVARFVQGQITTEHCFFNRDIARQACSLHSHTGEWLGMLPKSC